jgi:soluble lytic murein transglycosylase-like protein
MTAIAQTVMDTAAAYDVDPRLALELAIQESALDQNRVSSVGAIGVMQLLPGTAADLGVDPYDVNQNIDGGVRYLAQQLAQYGDPALALAAYNWGPGHVNSALGRYGQDWFLHAPSETQSYVTSILGRVQSEYQTTLPTASYGGSDPNVPNLPATPGFTAALVFGAIALAFLLFAGRMRRAYED